MNRSDMCQTGLYTERGISGLDGYQTEYVVDQEQYIVRVPLELEAVGVLAEPFSVAEKAIAESVQLQLTRIPDSASSRDWVTGKRCLVAGLGPIGLLAALALRLRGAEVLGRGRRGCEHGPPSMVRFDWRTVHGRTPNYAGPPHRPDRIVRSSLRGPTGVPSLEFDLIDALAINGVYVVTGIPSGDRPLKIDGAEFIRRLVLRNQVMVGSVNASHDHFQLAVNDLAQAQARWPEHVAGLITQRHNYTEFETAFQHHGSDEIKVVLEWGGNEPTPKNKADHKSYHDAQVV